MQKNRIEDIRSKNIIFLAHCIINQNAVSYGTATQKGLVNEIIDLMEMNDVGIIQMPCPEMHCLGLDRSGIKFNGKILHENTQIRAMMSSKEMMSKVKRLSYQVICQIEEYNKSGYKIKGIVGINRSPSCGVETTTYENKEKKGEGIFIEIMMNELRRNNIKINFLGIKTNKLKESIPKIKRLLGFY